MDSGGIHQDGKYSWRTKDPKTAKQYREAWKSELETLRRGEDEYLFPDIGKYEKRDAGIKPEAVTKIAPPTERGKMWNFILKTKDGTIYEGGTAGHAFIIHKFGIPMNDIADAGVVVKSGKHSWRSKIIGRGALPLEDYKDVWLHQLRQMRRGGAEDLEYLYQDIGKYIHIPKPSVPIKRHIVAPYDTRGYAFGIQFNTA